MMSTTALVSWTIVDWEVTALLETVEVEKVVAVVALV